MMASLRATLLRLVSNVLNGQKKLRRARYQAVIAYADAKRRGDTRDKHKYAAEADRLTLELLRLEGFGSSQDHARSPSAGRAASSEVRA